MILVVHPDVSKQLSIYESHLPQALLLTGKPGVGLNTIARQIATKFTLHAYLKPELLTKTSTVPQISIERIRELYVLSRAKQPKAAVVIIDDGDAMTESAQNSFLKLLEEPPSGIHFILTSHSPENLLPTVKSRSQILHVRPVTSDQTEKLISSFPEVDEVKRRQISFLADGLPAEIHRLYSDEAYFRKRSERIRIAKQLAEGSTRERLSVLMKHTLTRDEAISTIKQLISLLERTPQPASINRIQKLLKALDRIESGGNIRLQLVVGVV